VFEKFIGSTYQGVFMLHKNVDNRITLYSTDNDNLEFLCEANDVRDTVAYNGAGITAGTTYLIEVEYNSTDCTLKIDGVLKATASPAGGIDFGANIPDTVYIGTDSNLSKQADAVFSAP